MESFCFSTGQTVKNKKRRVQITFFFLLQRKKIFEKRRGFGLLFGLHPFFVDITKKQMWNERLFSRTTAIVPLTCRCLLVSKLIIARGAVMIRGGSFRKKHFGPGGMGQIS